MYWKLVRFEVYFVVLFEVVQNFVGRFCGDIAFWLWAFELPKVVCIWSMLVGCDMGC